MTWDNLARPAVPRARTWERSGSLQTLDRLGPKAVALYHYWNSRRGNRAMPSRHDIDPLEMRPWLARITLADVGEGGDRFTYRLVGTQIVDLLGVNPTGQPVESAWPDEAAEFVRDGYRKVVETGAPVFCHQVCTDAWNERPGAWSMRLPLSSNGHDVDVILGYLSDNIGMLSQL